MIKKTYILPYIGNIHLLNTEAEEELKNIIKKIVSKKDCPKLYEYLSDFNSYKNDYPIPSMSVDGNDSIDINVNLIYKNRIKEILEIITNYNFLSYSTMKALMVFFMNRLGLQDIIINKSKYNISPDYIQILPLFDAVYYDIERDLETDLVDRFILKRLYDQYFLNKPYSPFLPIDHLTHQMKLKFIKYELIYKDVYGSSGNFSYHDISYNLNRYNDRAINKDVFLGTSDNKKNIYKKLFNDEIDYFKSYIPSYLFTIKDCDNNLIRGDVKHYYTNKVIEQPNLYERAEYHKIETSVIHPDHPITIYNDAMFNSLVSMLPKETKYQLRNRCDLDYYQKASISLLTSKPSLIVIQLNVDEGDKYKITEKYGCIYIDEEPPENITLRTFYLEPEVPPPPAPGKFTVRVIVNASSPSNKFLECDELKTTLEPNLDPNDVNETNKVKIFIYTVTEGNNLTIDFNMDDNSDDDKKISGLKHKLGNGEEVTLITKNNPKRSTRVIFENILDNIKVNCDLFDYLYRCEWILDEGIEEVVITDQEDLYGSETVTMNEAKTYEYSNKLKEYDGSYTIKLKKKDTHNFLRFEVSDEYKEKKVYDISYLNFSPDPILTVEPLPKHDSHFVTFKIITEEI